LYPTAGTYTVSLTATNSAGSDTEIKTNYITVDKLCPTSITVYHTAGLVSPVTKTVIYEIVETTLSGVNKCWISRNLGADNQAGSATDATEAAAGWYWQFNRKQGYKHDGTTRTPSSTWITPIDENSNWTAANDPCSINLGLGWHIPTYTEWTNVVNNGGWNDYGDTYASVLKLHVNGSLTNTGSLSGRGSYGFRWSSAQFSTNNGWYLSFASTYCSIGSNGYKAFAYSIRCIRD
jgi:hypothetical protein